MLRRLESIVLVFATVVLSENRGIIVAARTAMRTTTINISIKVKALRPRLRFMGIRHAKIVNSPQRIGRDTRAPAASLPL